MHANIAQRLVRVRKHLDGESVFLANYTDGLSDIRLDQMIADFQVKNAVASFAGVTDWRSFHSVEATKDGWATHIGAQQRGEFLINGGFFVFRKDIFDYIENGDELVEKPFTRLMEKRLLAVYRHSKFWRAMDTFKDKITLERMEANGDCPWMVWRS